MRIGTKVLQLRKLPIPFLFLVGFTFGIIVMNFGKSILLENTGLLDEYALYHMKYMTVNSNALFYYVLTQRFRVVAFLTIAATTYLGLVACAGTVMWYGTATGAFLSALVIRYGLKGILFALTGIFPQYLLYIPAMFAMLLWCEGTCRNIYFQSNTLSEKECPTALPRRLLRLLLIFLLFFIGSVLESYLNPFFMSGLLKFF